MLCREAMKNLPQSEYLGTYTAKAGTISAKLKLRADIVHLGFVSSGDDWYAVDVTFSTSIRYQNEKEGFSVTAHYSTNVLSEIFARMKAADAGIEEFLKSDTEPKDAWKKRHDIMRCIFSLEDQTQHLYKKREEAKIQRNITVYGRENPRDDD